MKERCREWLKNLFKGDYSFTLTTIKYIEVICLGEIKEGR